MYKKVWIRLRIPFVHCGDNVKKNYFVTNFTFRRNKCNNQQSHMQFSYYQFYEHLYAYIASEVISGGYSFFILFNMLRNYLLIKVLTCYRMTNVYWSKI